MPDTITFRPTIPKAQLQKRAGGNLNRWINGLIETAVGEPANGGGKFPAKPRRTVRPQANSVRIPNRLTAATLAASKTGKDVKSFSSKKTLYADLGL